MLERQLIEYCAPTLASLKTANLFNYRYTDEEELMDSVDDWNSQMAEKGIFMSVLRMDGRSALIYVCRMSRLERDMRQPGTEDFLRYCGYEDLNPVQALARLRTKLQAEEGFPHEIGVFLGYPLGDVIGFMINEGKNYMARGYWKVYTNVGETVRTFEKFNKCKNVYARLWREGRSVRQLTVAA
ncbi:MAG: DUF3793 family protein [Eubacteriales bacterium]|nr:DUF3793 family protein [Eubacteriales bacterium]